METPKTTFNLTETSTELKVLSPDLADLTEQSSVSEADEQLLTVPELIRGENELSSLFNPTDSSVESISALATSHSANSTQDSGLLKESSQYTLGLLAIFSVVLISASTSTATKQALVYFSPSVLFAIRFAIAAIIFVPFVRDFNRAKSGELSERSRLPTPLVQLA